MESQNANIMKAVFMIICSSVVLGNSVTSKYSFVCNEDMSIDFIGILPQAGGRALINDTGNLLDCDGEKWNQGEANQDGVVHIPSTCIQNNTNETRNVFVRVWDKHFNVSFPITKSPIEITTTDMAVQPNSPATESTQNASQTTTASTTSRTSTRTSMIFGGKDCYHQFELTCYPIPGNGLHEQSVNHFQESDIKPIPKLQNEVSQIDMYFMKEKRYKSTDQEISNIFVGEPFYLILRYDVSSPHYDIIPELCTAFEGDDVLSTNHVELWNTNLKDSRCIGNDATTLIEKFRKVKDGEVSAKLYGFRFKNSNYITIQCNVTVCLLGNNDCKKSSCIDSSLQRRKKRNGDTETSKGDKNRVQRALKVFDTQRLHQLNDGNTKFNAVVTLYIAAYLVIFAW